MGYFNVLFLVGFGTHFITNTNATKKVFANADWENDLVLDALQLKPNSSVVVAILPLRLSLCKLASIADGATKDHLLKALHFDSVEKAKNYYSTVSNMLNDFKRSELLLINKIYVNYSREVDTSFLANSSLEYGVETDSIGFRSSSAALSFINNHVASATYRRILKVLEPDDITPQTNMIMITASNLKSTWEFPFLIKKTVNRKFFHLSNRVSEIPMMVLEDFFQQYENKEFKMLKIKLRNYGVVFTIVVPNLSKGLPAFLLNLRADPDLFNRCRKDMTIGLLKLVLPRFKIKSYLDLTENFKQSAVKDILNSSSSDLNSILKKEFRNKKNMFISKIKQNLFLQVDEFGSLRHPLRLGLPRFNNEQGWRSPKEFAADRPFYFTVEFDVNSRHPIFHGVYYGPE